MLWLLLAISIVLLVIPLSPYVRLRWEKYSASANFLYTVVATFLGVYLSIYVSEREAQRNDRDLALVQLQRMEEGSLDRLRWLRKMQMVMAAQESCAEFVEASLPLISSDLLGHIFEGSTSVEAVSPQFLITAGSALSAQNMASDEFRGLKSPTADDCKDLIDTNQRLLKRFIVAIETERLYLRGNLTSNDLEVIHRCLLDPAQTPMTERGFDELGCKDSVGSIDVRVLNKLEAFERNLEAKHPG